MSGKPLKLTIGGLNSHIDINNYVNLCDNFIFLGREDAEKYKSQGSITFKQLRNMCRRDKLSYPLFFADTQKVDNLIKTYNDNLYGKINEKTVLTIGSRDKNVDVRNMRWIIADIAEKQKIYKEFGNNTNLNKTGVVKFLKNSKKNVSEQAEYILTKVGISRDEIIQQKGKAKALKYLEGKLSQSQIHVYRQAGSAMPQTLPKDFIFSGVYIRDNFNPVIFLGNEFSLYPEEGAGRKIYTLAFLLVSIFKDYSFVVYIDQGSSEMDDATKRKLSEIHAITNAILMPEAYLRGLRISTIDQIKDESTKLKVSPTALTVRLSMLGILSYDKAQKIKDQLQDEYLAYTRSIRAKNKENRKLGKNTGPSLAALCKSYQGDFIDFVKNNVPEVRRREIFESRISYGRQYIKYEDLYG